MAVITKPFAVDALANKIKDLIVQALAGQKRAQKPFLRGSLGLYQNYNIILTDL